MHIYYRYIVILRALLYIAASLLICATKLTYMLHTPFPKLLKYTIGTYACAHIYDCDSVNL